MKKAHVMTFALAAVMSLGGLVGCSGKGNNNSGSGDGEFSFSIGIDGDYATLEVRDTPYKLVVFDNGVTENNISPSSREYTYSSDDPTVATINHQGSITTIDEGPVRFTVKETFSGIEQSIGVDVIPPAPLANGGQNFAATSVGERTKILGKLEEYAMDTHLTGISLFENGGYMLYSNRASAILPTRDYITGYGFGLLADAAEGFSAELPGGGRDNDYPMHYHTASSSDPLTINALNASGSQVSDLSSYITSSYFSMRMKKDKSGAEWYPLLADPVAHAISGKSPKMYHMGEKNDSGMYTRWRIYVRTDIEYRYNGSQPYKDIFDKRQVQLEDYEFILRFLLTGSHKLSRGTEMANDTSYGIKGARTYHDLTAVLDKGMPKPDVECKKIWDGMSASGRLGVKTGVADGTEPYETEGFYPAGSYIEFDLLNPVNAFTAMYTLSSNLYSPIPADFMDMIGRNPINPGQDERPPADADGRECSRAASRYGQFNDTTSVPSHLENNIVESTISLGAYYLDYWKENDRTVFTVNDDWYERDAEKTDNNVARYHVKGVRIKIDAALINDPDAYFKEWEVGNLDSCSVPTKKLDQWRDKALKAEGDSVFKLNVNSSTQEQWDARFGTGGSIAPGHARECKPWMSNDNFLNGLFWSINRKQFAEKRGVEPSINYFSGSYMSDPEENVSYNTTPEHKEAIRNYHRVVNGVDDYGYDKDLAIQYFKAAVSQLVKQDKLHYGTPDNPYKISIEIWWMYTSDVTEYGVDIKNYFESAFNSPSVSNGRIVLNVENYSVPQWELVYSAHLQVGMFDLGFGAISGNTYSPLNFLEVLKSDNSSTFTLNWGADTSLVDEKHPLVYNGHKYSFDALWEAADHGGIIQNGRRVKPVKDCYLNGWGSAADLMNMTSIDLVMNFATVDDVSFEVESVTLYVVGGASFGEAEGVRYNKTTKKIELPADKSDIKNNIISTFKLETKSQTIKDGVLKRINYGADKYYVFDITYSLSIGDSDATLNSLLAFKDKSAQDSDKDWKK